MQPTKSQKPYKKKSKSNVKKKEIAESSTGELVVRNSGKRYPIISLPDIVPNHVIQEYRRFVNNGGAVNGFITIYDLLNQYMFSVTALLLYSWVRAIRIKKIRILAPVTSQGTSVTLMMKPEGIDASENSFNAVPEMYLDTSASIDVPAYLSLTPSLDTPFGSWHWSIAINDNLVKVKAPAGSTMDILFEYLLVNDTASTSYSRVVAGATVGIFYSANIMTNFVPQERNVI